MRNYTQLSTKDEELAGGCESLSVEPDKGSFKKTTNTTTLPKKMGFVRLSFVHLVLLTALAFLGVASVLGAIWDLGDLFPFLDSSDDSSSDSFSSDSASGDSASGDSASGDSASGDSSDTAPWFSSVSGLGESPSPPLYSPFDQADLTSGINGP